MGSGRGRKGGNEMNVRKIKEEEHLVLEQQRTKKEMEKETQILKLKRDRRGKG